MKMAQRRKAMRRHVGEGIALLFGLIAFLAYLIQAPEKFELNALLGATIFALIAILLYQKCVTYLNRGP